jgi:Holliday junction resolvase
MGQHGVPDFICCCDGKFLAIETKYKNGKPTALQRQQIQSITVAGGNALVINEENLHVVEAWCEALSGVSG